MLTGIGHGFHVAAVLRDGGARMNRPGRGGDAAGAGALRPIALDLALIAAVLLLALWRPLALPRIYEQGEAREGLVVQDIVREGRWILPLRNGELPSKPPAFHWLAATAVRIAGFSDRSVRLPSALAAVAMAWCVFWLGACDGRRAAGWLSVGALLGTVQFWKSASEARVDMLFAAAITLSLTGFYAWDRSRRVPGRLLCYAAAALAVLTKGPAGAVLPGVVILVFLGAQGRWRDLRALWSWRLALGVLGVDAGWYLLAWIQGGSAFLGHLVVYENVDRFVGAGDFAGRRHSLQLVAALATRLLPWNLALPYAAVRWWRGERTPVAERFLHCWWVAVLAVFTLAAGKRNVYLLPLYPAIAVLAGRGLQRLAPRLSTRAGDAGAVRARAASLRRLAVAVAAFDAVVLVTLQASNEMRAAGRSIVRFADQVASLVPAETPLTAFPAVDDAELWALAYRLRRPIRRRSPPARAYAIVPAAEAEGLASRGYRVLAESHRRGRNVALVRHAEESRVAPQPSAVRLLLF
jgi:4-amino-4-deoxy-L-arabinose transferase-like glycosyltransferase